MKYKRKKVFRPYLYLFGFSAADVALFSDLSSSSRNNLTQTLSTINNGMEQYRFCLREKLSDSVLWSGNFAMDPQILRDYFYRFLYQPVTHNPI